MWLPRWCQRCTEFSCKAVCCLCCFCCRKRMRGIFELPAVEVNLRRSSEMRVTTMSEAGMNNLRRKCIWCSRCCNSRLSYQNHYHKCEGIVSFFICMAGVTTLLLMIAMLSTQISCTNMLDLPVGLSWGQFIVQMCNILIKICLFIYMLYLMKRHTNYEYDR